jgi:50S ribosomal protein L16 3-hydroxylase
LRAFSFVPAARIDDLMVSYAADGGSVGPHDDRYDVFLLQGPGRRRWQISTQADRRTDPRAKIRVLADFVPEAEWLLEPGDMLYLPPGVAHHGVAEGPCFTYSIGFLAPSHRELVGGFLGYLAESLVESTAEDALYEDPDLKPAKDALEIGDAMVKRVSAVIGRVDWGEAAVGDFLGRFLTRPRPRVRFETPARSIALDAFARRLGGRGRLSLALPSRGLFRKGRLFLNGEGYPVSRTARAFFHQLVGERSVELPIAPEPRVLGLLHAWNAAGYVSV